MTRPRKQTVDWFPHSCNHGMTMYVLDKRYGIAGYYFWFRLLELLGDTEGHFIDTENPVKFEYLQAYTQTDKTTCMEILDLLATLEAIDPKLWKDKLIWSDNFIKGLAALYRNRNVPLPARPDNYRKKTGSSGKKGVENRQGSRGSRVEEGKEEDNAEPGPPDTAPALKFFSCKFFEVDFDYRMKLAKEYPALNDDLLLKEFSKMEDWIVDNKSKKTFKANGQLGNPRLFIKNWLNKAQVSGQELFGGKNDPKGYEGFERVCQRESRRC